MAKELERLGRRVKELEFAEQERQQAQNALRELEEEFRDIYDEAPVGLHELDPEGRIIRVNRTELEMLGYTAEEILGRPVWKLVVEEETTRKVILARIGGDVSFHETFERNYRRKDGTALPVLVEDRILRDREGRITGIRSTIRDLTERKKVEEALRRSEEQLRQWQKVEAIGRLAGGVAHDFNNYLMTIKGCSDFLLQSFDPDDSRRDELKEIRRACERAAELTHQLLAFARKQVLKPEVVSLNEIVTNTSKMLQRLIGEDIQLQAVLAGDLCSVKVDVGQIEQVLMNLALNAREALPRGGKITIETANVFLDEDYAARHVSVKPGFYALLAVSDNGCGMDREIQSHLFEPFFTTKEKGKGTGLGLSTVYGIIKQSGGNIWAYSEPGLGTTMKVYLPRAQESLPAPPVKAASPSAAGGSETILLVEDDEAVRTIVRRILKDKGYTVLEAHDGTQALQTSENFQGPIHLMITDVVMPQISGRELAERLSIARPQMRVLYMSGYPDSAIMHQGALQEGAAFIQKPFSITALEAKVREIMDRSESKREI